MDFSSSDFWTLTGMLASRVGAAGLGPNRPGKANIKDRDPFRNRASSLKYRPRGDPFPTNLGDSALDVLGPCFAAGIRHPARHHPKPSADPPGGP